MRDFASIQVFTRGFLQDAVTLMKVMEREGITKEDISEYIGQPVVHATGSGIELEKPCCGKGKVDKQVKAFREKQEKLRMERLK